MTNSLHKPLRYGELFAGAGGLSLGLHRAGWECAFHAEIDPFARRVLEKRFPGVPLYGDVTTLSGSQLVAECGEIDLLSGGSPCQDLSQAGRRAGIVAGARSSLFFTQMQLWEETGAEWCLWENVHGALSSGKGEDFRYVLSAFVGDDIGRAVDRKGRVLKWPNSGVVCGPTGVAAWRVLDAQYWGVPQRRRRVFVLGTRTGIIDPAEVLFDFEGVRWNHPASGPTGEAVAARAGAGPGHESGEAADRGLRAGHRGCRAHSGQRRTAAGAHAGAEEESEGEGRLVRLTASVAAAGEVNRNGRAYPREVLSFYAGNGAKAHGIGLTQDVSAPLKGQASGNNQVPTVLCFDSTFGSNANVFENESPPLKVGSALGIPSPPAIYITGVDFRNTKLTGEVMPTMQAHHGSHSVNATPHVLSLQETHALVYDARGNGEGEVSNTLVGDHQRRVSDYTAIVFDVKQSGESAEGVSPTLRAMVHSGSHANGGGQLGVVRHIIDYCNCSKMSQSEKPSIPDCNGQCEHDSTIVFDRAQITHPENRSTVIPNAPCPAIAAKSQLHVARMRAFGDYECDGTASALKARDYKDATDLVYSVQGPEVVSFKPGQSEAAGATFVTKDYVPTLQGQNNGTTAVPAVLTNDENRQQVPEVAGTLGSFSPTGGHRGDLDTSGAYPVTFGVPRRLLPVECERLMGWPSGWTEVADEKGKPAKDAPRYKACGNGVVSHCVDFIGLRLAAAERLRRELGVGVAPLKQAA